ncbi:hypothetical protein [Aquibacillus saliphilus]|uniref:hypothetical protein n=1 Tax=Aquibacillus saliphilus TaxID=1909422 RepID=UPI001CF07A46|nr:hypothetical protein [Aquibacillus saliphilus]
MSNIIESQIDGTFYGWSGDTLFKLTNGQYWVQSNYAYNYHYAYRPHVQIIEKVNRYYLEVEGMNNSIEVRKLFSVIESVVTNDFNGWDGETIFELQNGQVWQQASYAYNYHYAYIPQIIIYESGGGYKLHVEGVTETLPVRRIG